MTFDIDQAIASRDQSFTPEPVQRAANEPFQRMGYFGRKKYAVAAPEPTEYQKLSGGQAIAKFLVDSLGPEIDKLDKQAMDKEIYDWFSSGDVNNWSKDQLGLANNLYDYYSSANTHDDVPENLVNTYQELVGSKKKASDNPTGESAKPAEARLDQPDARDSSS